MSKALSQKSILILDPCLDQIKLYSLLDSRNFELSTFSNPLVASTRLEKENFDLVFLSCSFSNKKLLSFLESLKQNCKNSITPLVFVVNLSEPYSIVPGTNWDNKISILSSQSSEKELEATLTKLL